MDVAMPSACPKQTCYDYLDLARAAHSCEIAKLCEENERLKAQVHSFLNHAASCGLPEKVTNSGMSVGLSQWSDAQSVQNATIQPTTSWASDHMMFDELGEIVLLERKPGDVEPKGANDIGHSSRDELWAAPHERSSLAMPLSLPLQESEKNGCGKGLAGWAQIYNALWESWNSDNIVMHPAWTDASLQALSMFMARNHQGGGDCFLDASHCLSEHVLQRTEKHRFNSCGVISPDSSFVVIWQSLSLILCVYDIVMFPIQMIDLFPTYESSHVLTVLVAVFWSMDIAISLQTGFPTNEGYTELRRIKIFKRYAKTWMALDVTIVVFDWISLLVTSGHEGSLRGVSRMVRRLSRMLRCGRLIKLGPTIVKSMGQLNSEIFLSVAKLVLYLCVILTLNHYIACVMYATWDWNELNFTDTHRYLTCLHWAINHSALGSMDISPRSDFERLFSTIMLVFAMCLFSTFLSAITTAITHLSNLHGYKVKQSGLMRKFFDENRISRELSRRIWTFMWKHIHLGKARLRTSDVHCFSLLPSHMLAEIKVEMFLPILIAHPMFKLCSEQSLPSIVQVCLTGIQQKVCRPFEPLIWSSDAEIKGMLFVVHGSLQYKPLVDPGCISPSQQQDATVCKGMWACEAALWCQHAQVYGPLIGGTAGADVVHVSAREFQDIMRTSTLSFMCRDYAQMFIDRFNQCSHDSDCLDSLFNDRDMIKELVLETTFKRSGATFCGKSVRVLATRVRLRSVASPVSSKQPVKVNPG